MQFKGGRKSGKYGNIKAEYESLTINPRLWAFLEWLDAMTNEHWDKEIMITCLTRTGIEQIKHYPTYYRTNKKPHPSLHCFDPCSAADIRTTTRKWFDKPQQRIIAEWFRKYHETVRNDKCFIEKDHIHFQMEYMGLDKEPLDIGTVE